MCCPTLTLQLRPLASPDVSVEIVLTPLSGSGPGLLDALEARTGRPPYRTRVMTGARTYSLETDDENVAFDRTLDQLAPFEGVGARG